MRSMRKNIWKGKSGYWASVQVSFNQKHCELTIPVTLDITRVDGGA